MIEKVDYENKQVLKNLYQLYLHDLSVYIDEDIDAAGLYDVDFINEFWETEGLSAFFIKSNARVLGFILLQNGKYAPPSGEDYYISEFFILRKYRRNAVGKRAVEKLFDVFPGKYLLCEIPTNNLAIIFWKSIYLQFKLDFKESLEDLQGGEFLFQRFEVKRIVNKDSKQEIKEGLKM